MHVVHWRRVGALVLLSAAAAVGQASCVRNESSLFIRGCLAVPHDTCTVMASETSEFIFHGSIDGAYAAQYTCLLLVENQLVARGDPTKLRTETSRVELQYADVQILNTSGQLLSATSRFTVPISGFVDPGQGTTAGVGSTDVVLLDATTVGSLAAQAISAKVVQQVVASVIIRGRTLGGTDVNTNEFLFPIDVCGGCSCTVLPGKGCFGGTDQPPADCRLGLDEDVDCRYLASQDACHFLSGCTMNTLGEVDLTTSHCPSSPGKADGTCCP